VIETRNKIVAGHRYDCTLFPAMKGYKIARKIAKLFSTAFGGIVPSDSSRLLDNEINFSKVIDELIAIDEDGDFILELLANTIRDEQVINRGSFDRIYQNNYLELIGALQFVLECNFSEFFDLFKDKKKDTDEQISKKVETTADVQAPTSLSD
jgi:hypothetical protein